MIHVVEFTEQQREACKQMGKRAGVEVLRIINEPTAAAIAYGLHQKAMSSVIMVFDFGGGTLDVSLLRLDANVFETIEVSGDDHLGGEDLNHCLMDHHVKKLAEFIMDERKKLVSRMVDQTNGEQQEGTPDEHVLLRNIIQQLKGNKVKMQLLRDNVERMKLELSEKDVTFMEMDVSEFVQEKEEQKQKQKQQAPMPTILFKTSLTRTEFETIGHDIFERVLIPVKEVLELSGMNKSEVDEVVLVGGSTRIPKVRDLLRHFFDGKQPNCQIDPDQAVAIGTALQAGTITDSWPVPVAAVEKPYRARERTTTRRQKGRGRGGDADSAE